MDELFSCRNCIYNPSQSLYLGHGQGYCTYYNTILESPFNTTCKFLFRKDIPNFLWDSSEHKKIEDGVINGNTKVKQSEIIYSERYYWENNEFDSLLDKTTKYGKGSPKWIFISSFFLGDSAREIVAATSLSRRYMSNCQTWKSSYRFAYEAILKLNKNISIDGKDTAIEDEDYILLGKIDAYMMCLNFLQEFAHMSNNKIILEMIDTMMEIYFELDYQKILSINSVYQEKLKNELIGFLKQNDSYFFNKLNF